MMNQSFLSPIERVGVGSRARSPLQVFLETQFKCLADGGDDVLRQPTSAFEDIASPTVDIVLGDVGDEIERVLESSKQYNNNNNNNNGPFIIKRGFSSSPRERESEGRVNYHFSRRRHLRDLRRKRKKCWACRDRRRRYCLPAC